MRKLLVFSGACCVLLLTGSGLGLNHSDSILLKLPDLVPQAAAGPSSQAKTSQSVPAQAREELLAAAKKHQVQIKPDRIAYFDTKEMTIVRAPLVGFEKRSDADFANGAPFELMIVKSKTKLAVPDGSYVVKLQYRKGVPGNAIFTDASGKVIAQRSFDRPVLILPDPDIPGRDDHGEAGVDPCDGYGEMFNFTVVAGLPGGLPITVTKCSECACNHNHGYIPSGEVEAASYYHAWMAGLEAGRECLRSRAHICPRIPGP